MKMTMLQIYNDSLSHFNLLKHFFLIACFLVSSWILFMMSITRNINKQNDSKMKILMQAIQQKMRIDIEVYKFEI